MLLLLAEGRGQYVTTGFDVWAAGRAGAEMPQEPGSRLYPEAESWAGAMLHPCRWLCIPERREDCSHLGDNGSKSSDRIHGTWSVLRLCCYLWLCGAVVLSLALFHPHSTPHCSAAARTWWQQVTSCIGTEVLQGRMQLRGWIQYPHYEAGVFLASVWLSFYCWPLPVSI